MSDLEIENDEELQTILSYFHDLGVLVHFSDGHDPVLRQTVIIDPVWLFDVFTRILNPKESNVRYEYTVISWANAPNVQTD